MEKPAAEKRAFIRMKLNTEVLLQAQDGTEEFLGICKDMSGVGLLVKTDAPLAVDTQITAKIKSKGEHIVYHGSVKRIVESEGERCLAISIEDILD